MHPASHVTLHCLTLLILYHRMYTYLTLTFIVIHGLTSWLVVCLPHWNVNSISVGTWCCLLPQESQVVKKYLLNKWSNKLCQLEKYLTTNNWNLNYHCFGIQQNILSNNNFQRSESKPRVTAQGSGQGLPFSSSCTIVLGCDFCTCRLRAARPGSVPPFQTERQRAFSLSFYVRKISFSQNSSWPRWQLSLYTPWEKIGLCWGERREKGEPVDT